MSGGTWTLGRIDLDTNNAPTADAFKSASSGTAAGTAGIVISSKPGRFYRGIFQNSSATKYYVQVFDKATAPVNTDVPVFSKTLPASGEVEIDLTNVNGLRCLLGIGIAISTTAGVLTLAVATDLAFRRVVYTAKP